MKRYTKCPIEAFSTFVGLCEEADTSIVRISREAHTFVMTLLNRKHRVVYVHTMPRTNGNNISYDRLIDIFAARSIIAEPGEWTTELANTLSAVCKDACIPE